MLCDDLEEWDAGWKEGSRREGIYVFLQLILFVAQQKLTQ